MDSVAPLASQLMALLAPFLPHLVNAGQSLAEGAADEAEKRKGSVAQAIWDKVFPKIEAAPAASEAARDAAAAPGDADMQAALRVQLRKLLAEDPELVAELTAVLAEAEADPASISVVASGERSVAVQGNVQGSIITGDSNRVAT